MMSATEADKTLVVLLTAAIQPAVGVHVSDHDVARRRDQYTRAFLAWASRMRAESRLRLIVVESSNERRESFDDVFQGVADRVEWISFAAPSDLNKRGKGAIEGAMIEFALATASTPLVDETTLFKATGRIDIQNALNCIDELAPNHVRARYFVDRSRYDVRFFGAPVAVWRSRLFGLADVVDEPAGIHLGNAVAARLAAPTILGEIVLEQFPQRPSFRGVSGSNGRKYGTLRHRLAEVLEGPTERALGRFAAWKSI